MNTFQNVESKSNKSFISNSEVSSFKQALRTNQALKVLAAFRHKPLESVDCWFLSIATCQQQ